jgi:NADPH:quinone reductase-like Zn-dependent oxidoreductase
MAALGLGSVTAFEALRKIGDLKNWGIAVTGAASGVGSAAHGLPLLDEVKAGRIGTPR